MSRPDEPSLWVYTSRRQLDEHYNAVCSLPTTKDAVYRRRRDVSNIDDDGDGSHVTERRRLSELMRCTSFTLAIFTAWRRSSRRRKYGGTEVRVRSVHSGKRTVGPPTKKTPFHAAARDFFRVDDPRIYGLPGQVRRVADCSTNPASIHYNKYCAGKLEI